VSDEVSLIWVEKVLKKASLPYYPTSLIAAIIVFLVYEFFSTVIRLGFFAMDPYHRIATLAASILVAGQLIGIHYFLNKMRSEFKFLLPFNGYGTFIKDRDKKYHAIAGFIAAIYIAIQLLYTFQGRNIFGYGDQTGLWILLDIFYLAVNLLNFFLLSTILWIYINIVWAIRQISSKQCQDLIHVDIFNIDRAGGLSRIRKFILEISIFYLIIMIFTILSYITPFEGILSYENRFIMILLLIGVGFFISSLGALNSILKDKIQSEFIINTQQYKIQKDKLKSILSGNKSAETDHELNSISVVLNLYSNERSWLLSLDASIWDIATLGTYTVTLLASLMTFILNFLDFLPTIYKIYGIIIKPF
jgi:hypothetical protein